MRLIPSHLKILKIGLLIAVTVLHKVRKGCMLDLLLESKLARSWYCDRLNPLSTAANSVKVGDGGWVGGSLSSQLRSHIGDRSDRKSYLFSLLR